MTRFTAACVQLDVGTEIELNMRDAGALIRRARDAGATLIATPENTGFMVDIDLARVAEARDAVPVLRHDRRVAPPGPLLRAAGE